MMETTVKAIIQLFEKWVPKDYAESWDNVGLQLGDLEQSVQNLLITLDVTDEIVEEAIEHQVQLIIAHHPLLFKGLKQIDVNDSKGRIIQKLLKNNISVYAAHTNLDMVNGGVNDLLADKLCLKNRQVLVPSITDKLYKFMVYVPKSHANVVKEAIGKAGAGHIGNYSHCTFETAGMGAFKPLEGTNPFLGKKGKIEEVEEIKIETIVKEKQLSKIIEMAKQSHPYEEMAYDVFPLNNSTETLGLGRIGLVEKEMTLKEYLSFVKDALDVPFVRFVGDENKIVRSVAVLGGSGKGYIINAIKMGADVYITGDLSFHDAQDAEQAGICLIDPGHHVERVMKDGVKCYFDHHQKELPTPVNIITSTISTEPFKCY